MVIEAIELLYYKNLLFPANFVDERKGSLAVIISNETCSKMDSEQQVFLMLTTMMLINT